MATYKCDTCGNVRDFPSIYQTIYCQEIGCDGMCHRLPDSPAPAAVAEKPAVAAPVDDISPEKRAVLTAIADLYRNEPSVAAPGFESQVSGYDDGWNKAVFCAFHEAMKAFGLPHAALAKFKTIRKELPK